MMLDVSGVLFVAIGYFVIKKMLQHRFFARFRDVIYVRVSMDRLCVVNVKNHANSELIANPVFSHPRTLLGNFTVAQTLLTQAIGQITTKKFLSPMIVIHPLDNIDGGLTQIEERAFQELAIGAGAAKAVVWDGPEPSDEQILKMFN